MDQNVELSPSRLIVGIDPSPNLLAIVAIRDGVIVAFGYRTAAEAAGYIDSLCDGQAVIAIEMIASYGMAVGESIFETCVQIGILMESLRQSGMGHPVVRLTRHSVKMEICKSAKAKDGNIRQALIDIYGPVGSKKSPGGTFGLANDLWAALAVATAYGRGAKTYHPRMEAPSLRQNKSSRSSAQTKTWTP